jgi:hypothetical protein
MRLPETWVCRWWSLPELDDARARGFVIWPTRLEEHLRAFLEHGPPREPVDLGS